LCVLLFRKHRRAGWLLLGAAFMTPLFLLFLRIAHGLPVLTYRSYGLSADGMAHLTYRFDIPGYCLVVVLALSLLLRDARRRRG
jgi:hypothetical protein